MRITQSLEKIWKRSVVTTRITVVAVGILLLLLITFVVIDYLVQRGHVVDELERYSDQFSRAVEGSLALGMISMRRDLLQGTIEQLTDDQAVDRVFLLNPRGKVAASTDVMAIDTFIPINSRGCRECHSGQAVIPRIMLIKETDEESYYRSVRPILNRESCQRCHDPEQSVNGLLVIDYNLSYLTGQVKDAWQRVALDTFLIALAALPVLIIVISLTVRRYLLHPMRKLEALATDIAHGEFPTEIKPEISGDVAQLGTVLIDMSRQLEESFEELKSARDYLNRMIDSIDDGLIVIDRDFSVTNINPSALALTSKMRSEVISNSCEAVCLCHGDEHLCPARMVYREKRTCRIETRDDRSDGTLKWYEIQASPLFDSSGEVVEVVEVIRDITRRRELERNVAHKDRLSDMGRFAASVAHEINTPLGTMMTCIEGLIRDLKRSPEMVVSNWEDLNPYLKTMLGSVQRGREIIQRLLMYVRQDEETRFVDVDINNIVINALDMLKHAPRSENVSFNPELAENLPQIRGEPTQLTQMIINLMQNSVDAIEGVGRVTIESSARDGAILVSVSDDGAGIPPELHSRVFEPFFTTKEVGMGTGLGLYLCREIVVKHGGEISWENLSPGTVFRVTLPFKEAGSR